MTRTGGVDISVWEYEWRNNGRDYLFIRRDTDNSYALYVEGKLWMTWESQAGFPEMHAILGELTSALRETGKMKPMSGA